TEFKTFFARRELKVINKRMQGGRIRSVQDGNYIATNPPLGYEIDHIKTYRTLKPIPAEADIVKMIYKMYLDGNGAKNIANYLNSLGIKTKAGNQFVPSAIIFILKNPIYIGKVTWKKKEIKKSKDPGKIKDTRSRDKSEWIISDGKHEPIIDIDTFNNVQKILNGKYHIPYQLKNAPVNPLAGIITCGVCGKKMVMRKLRGIPRMLCITSGCSNVSTRFDIFEKDMITALRDYLNNYKISVKSNNKTSNIEILKKQSTLLNKELNTLNNQKLKLFDLLERNIYTEEVFLERSKNIENRIATVSSELSNINSQIQSSSAAINKEDIINFENVLNAYESTTDVKTKNELLKNILYKIEYKKDKNCKGNDFEIKLYPKILR
ncbi:recombinase family protein, partial [Inconstantimicrobium porci]|uniref:recombinase family protein n=1 Tax=Inconstantimicrobium porci TaxID=2652291 RepID=UPI00240A50F5